MRKLVGLLTTFLFWNVMTAQQIGLLEVSIVSLCLFLLSDATFSEIHTSVSLYSITSYTRYNVTTTIIIYAIIANDTSKITIKTDHRKHS